MESHSSGHGTQEYIPLVAGDHEDDELPPYQPPASWPFPSRKARLLSILLEFSDLRLLYRKQWRERPKRTTQLVVLLLVLVSASCLATVAVIRHLSHRPRDSTLVFDRRELQTIWDWEINSHHYPSRRQLPTSIGLRYQQAQIPRSYLHNERIDGYPPRPTNGSIADLDLLMDACDHDTGKYVRDCLELLRVGGSLHSKAYIGDRQPEEMEYIYEEQLDGILETGQLEQVFDGTNTGLKGKPGAHLEQPLTLPAPMNHRIEESDYGLCDPEHPRIFHTYWSGEFTDKPYLSLLSFLYTQNLRLHQDEIHNNSLQSCMPQLWVWMTFDPSGILPRPDAFDFLMERLQSNPWSSPFLHPRFQRHIKFKLWNATEQLDATPEIKEEWRRLPLLHSEGKVFNSHSWSDIAKNGKSKSSIVLSDLVRFVLLHRYGGIYLDGDVLLLRDWEELWNWRGAFSYRWSTWDIYNTAILRMHKGSALTSFILRTAARNEWDFHPHTITNYMDDSLLKGLLYYLPSALFDPAWINTEKVQWDRPPVPFFRRFENFVETPAENCAEAQVIGFPGFFRGAFAYHTHQSVAAPFDPTRNWPELGSRFFDSANSSPRLVFADFDLSWSAVVKRTFESYLRGEAPNMYGEYLQYQRT